MIDGRKSRKGKVESLWGNISKPPVNGDVTYPKQ
jgi:hypothetical protein